jgi:hypothetical protein
LSCVGAGGPLGKPPTIREPSLPQWESLLPEFNAYLDRRDTDPATDAVGYRQHGIWLDHDELAALLGQLRAAIVPHLTNQATTDRSRFLLSPIIFHR